jgi:hypothetical protein
LCFTPFLHDAFSEDFKISIAEEWLLLNLDSISVARSWENRVVLNQCFCRSRASASEQPNAEGGMTSFELYSYPSGRVQAWGSWHLRASERYQTAPTRPVRT